VDAFSNPISKRSIRIIMRRGRTLLAATITISLLIMCITLTTPTMASSKGSKGGGGPVTQEQVNSGNSNLDKEINKFYNCISKTHQDPPTIEKVDSCYYQALGGIGSSGVSTASNFGVTAPGSSPTSTSTSTSHHHKHRISTTNSEVPT
jgi:hypothetical protein